MIPKLLPEWLRPRTPSVGELLDSWERGERLRAWLPGRLLDWLFPRDPVLAELEEAATVAGENLDEVVRFLSLDQLERPKGDSVEIVFFDEVPPIGELPDGYLWSDPLPEWLSQVRGEWRKEYPIDEDWLEILEGDSRTAELAAELERGKR